MNASYRAWQTNEELWVTLLEFKPRHNRRKREKRYVRKEEETKPVLGHHTGGSKLWRILLESATNSTVNRLTRIDKAPID